LKLQNILEGSKSSKHKECKTRAKR